MNESANVNENIGRIEWKYKAKIQNEWMSECKNE